MPEKTKKTKGPVSQGVAYSTPVIMQLEALECGAACLDMILAYYGKWVPLEIVRADCRVSRDGSNMKNIMKAAGLYGLIPKAVKCEPEDLKEAGTFPCIVHWNFNHFVVLKGFKGKKVFLNDPARGAITISMEEFDEAFTGIAVLFKPGEAFIQGGKRKNMISFAFEKLVSTGSTFIIVAFSALLTAIISVISPGFSRVFIDRLLTNENPDWIKPFTVLFITVGICQVTVGLVNALFSLKMNGKLDVVGSANYIYKVLNLPMSFFSQRMSGDIQNRKTSNATVSSTLVTAFAPLILEGALMVLFLTVMLSYSILLTFISVVCVVLNAWISRKISEKRVNLTRVSLKNRALLSTCTVTGIEMIETIKSNGAENGYFAKWADYQAGVNNQEVRFTKLNTGLGLLPKIISSLCSVVIIIIGIYLTMNGKFSIGMLMAFQSFFTSFSTPADKLITSGQLLQEMRTQMERIDDVMQYPSDNVFKDIREKQDGGKLTGKISVKNVTFGYSLLTNPQLTDFSLDIHPGERIALVGTSGCGKSTVSKLISGLYTPNKGEILFDGKKISEIDKTVFKSSLAVVDQDITLFEDTVANNIKMWDDSIEDFEMILAARDAQIHDEIMLREKGYNHRLIEGGRDFSGGQRQRIEIARVLAQDPTIIILDEATSALDAKTEYDVVNAIKNRGITCIVVAHRLSTIRDCDKIVVMDKGRIIDTGTHEELTANCEFYKNLVTSE